MLHIGDPRGWWLLALAGLFLLVLLLRGRRRREPSSLFFLVRRLADRLAVTHRRLRVLRRAALALFAAAAVATAVAGLAPHTVSRARPWRDLVIADLSPSLGISEGGVPRLHQLRRALEGYVGQLRDGDAAVLVTAGPRAGASPALDASALRAAAARLDWADAPADVEGAARIAAALARSARFDHVLLFTDRPGRWEGREAAGGIMAFDPEVVTFGVPVPNAGIAAFDLEPDPLIPAAFDLYLRVACPAAAAPGGPGQPALTLINNERVLRQLRPPCAPGEAQELLLEDVLLERGQVEVRLEPGDAYAADDRVMAGISDAPAAKVVLVTSGNRFLRTALEAIPGVAVAVRSPEQPLSPEPRAIYVFDGRIPPGELPEKALFIQPDRRLDTLQVQTWRTYPERVVFESDDPLLRGVDLEGLIVKDFAAYVAPPGFSVAATADGWPLILSRSEGSRRWVVFAFSPDQTGLVYTASFPVLIAGTVRWLSLFTATERPFSRAGEPVFLPAAARGGRVQTPDGGSRLLPGAGAPALPFFETRHPGRYRVSAADGTALGNFFVNVADSAVSDDLAADGYGRGSLNPAPRPRRDPLGRQFAPALALLALALLAAERFLAAVRTSQRES